MWWILGIFTVASAFFMGYRSHKISTAVKQTFANFLSKKHVEINTNYYIVYYPYGVSWYKIIVPRNRRPMVIDSITDENGVDIKSQVLSFMGPGHNFHGMMVTPKMMGFQKITIEYGAVDKISKSFDTNVPILL